MDTDQALRAAMERAIEDARQYRHDNLPEWSENRLAFFLGQHLRSVVASRRLPAGELEPYAVAFWHACHELDSWETGLDDFCLQFANLWDGKKVMYARGNLLEIAEEQARQAVTHPALARYDNVGLRLLGQVCYELSLLQDADGEFFLAQEDAGKIVGKSQRMAGEIIHRLCLDGILDRVSKGSNLTKKASKYRWLPKT